jgi:hypothetical protein
LIGRIFYEAFTISTSANIDHYVRYVNSDISFKTGEKEEGFGQFRGGRAALDGSFWGQAGSPNTPIAIKP